MKEKQGDRKHYLDTVKALTGVNQVDAFFSKVYSLYSQSPKLQREFKEIAGDLEVQFRNVGRWVASRWVVSSFRDVNSLWQTYPASYKYFETLGTTTSDKATYKGLINKMKTVEN